MPPNKALMYIFDQIDFDIDDLDTRVGTEYDVHRMENTFGKYNISIQTFTNLRKNEIRTAIEEINRNALPTLYCIILVILTHGGKHQQIMARDGLFCFNEVIVNPLLANPNLKNVRKMFITQRCRAPYDLPIECCLNSGEQLESAYETIICNSTFEGMRSTRFSIGSPYIQLLCNVVERWGVNTDITDIMSRVSKEMKRSGLPQTPCYTSSLTESFILGDIGS